MLAAVTGLALSACANQDADIDDVREALEDTEGLSREQVDACVEGFEDADFSQDELNDIADAETLSDLSNELEERVDEILRSCIEGSTTTEGEGDGSTTTEGDGSAEEQDDTGDTGDEQGESSTTTAP